MGGERPSTHSSMNISNLLNPHTGPEVNSPTPTSQPLAESSPSTVPSLPPSRLSVSRSKPYTKEMIHWIRYHKVDRNMPYQRMKILFFEQFPERISTVSHQVLTMPYYRDNRRPELDEKGNWGFYKEGEEGKGELRTVPVPIRDRFTTKAMEIDFPSTLVDLWPERCLEYQWKSSILEEDKERVRQILMGNDPCDPYGKRANWRRILKECEEHIYKF